MANKVKTTLEFEIDANAGELLQKAAQIGFAQVATELVARFDDSLSGNYWSWPDATPRWGSSGGTTLSEAAENWNTWATGSGLGKAPKAVAGSPRSIVDSGDLKQSRDFQINRKQMKAEYSWNTDYAAAVYFGAYIRPFQSKTKVVYNPGRPWVQAVLEGGTSSSVPIYPVTENLTKYVTTAANNLK